MPIEIVDAKREAVPMLISLSGVSGAGKTFSALLLAAGLAGPGGKVGLLDTENRRGKMYADTPEIMQALPQGFRYGELREPFTPMRYIEAIQSFENDGCLALVIDSTSHSWEGYGGCTDIAENNRLRGMPNWALAKREHKRFVNYVLASKMHIIFCLRAREKVKIAKNDKGKEEFIPIGLQPIHEKGFTFEMMLSLLLDEKSHRPTVTKCPKPLLPLFSGEQAVITKEIGEKLRAWTESGAAGSESDPAAFIESARAYAAQGTEAYLEFWRPLTNAQKHALGKEHDKNKELARMADDHRRQMEAGAGSTLLSDDAAA